MTGYLNGGVAAHVRESLEESRRSGLAFSTAWKQATADRDDPCLSFAEDAFRRAYRGEPATPADHAAGLLVRALEALNDRSTGAVSVNDNLPTYYELVA